MNLKVFVFLLLFQICTSLFEGDDCVLIGTTLQSGKCVDINDCDYAKEKLNQSKRPQSCGFNRRNPLVCCPSTIKLISNISKSVEKCHEYHNVRSIPPNIYGGKAANPREFPHMTALGYGENKSDIVWMCGGTLISEKYILTAAHCTRTRDFGDPKWARMGDLNLNETTDDAAPQDIEIEKVFVHPDYKPPSHYNDIAILKLKKRVFFDFDVRPACLHTKKDLSNAQIQAIGWGKTDFLGDSSNHLMKVFLNVIEHKKCVKVYSNISQRRLPQGIKDESQICAGDASGKDTCPGDSGGPLHFRKEFSDDIVGHFIVVGITSFGKGCGIENSAGVYTRVSFYHSWIENIVWSEES